VIDSPEAAWTQKQVADHLTSITQLLRSDVFSRNAPFTGTTQTRWITLINAVSDLLRQALLAGKRIDFATESGTSSNAARYYGFAWVYAYVGLRYPYW